MHSYQRRFLECVLNTKALCFGQYTLKSGRVSPYFFNAGVLNSGQSLRLLGQAYAEAIIDSKLEFDMLFGPAYKGITLAAVTAYAFAELKARDVPVAFNRKEAKAHGESGILIGAPLRGRVLIIDDVITAGTSVHESVEIIKAQGAQPAGVIIALDRQERGQHGVQSAAQEVRARYGIPVFAIVSVNELLALTVEYPDWAQYRGALLAYQAQYGAVTSNF
jgi:orotate phosphoribosyltransferase